MARFMASPTADAIPFSKNSAVDPSPVPFKSSSASSAMDVVLDNIPFTSAAYVLDGDALDLTTLSGLDLTSLVPDLSISQLLSIRHDETFNSARRRKKGPKQAISAFAYYNAEHLESFAKDHPEASPEFIVSLIEEEWKNLSSSVRQLYDDMAAKDQERYNDQCQPALSKAKEEALKRMKKRKTPGAPKHPKSAYLFFVGANRSLVKSEPTLECPSFTEIAKVLGERWKLLPDEQREEYQQMANADKKRYRREKLEYINAKKDETSFSEAIDLDLIPEDDQFGLQLLSVGASVVSNGEDGAAADSENVKRKRKHPLAPKHPLSAYLFFVSTHRAALNTKFKTKTFTEVAQLIGDIWKQMDLSSRRKYEIMAQADKKRYEFEMNAWAKDPCNPANFPKAKVSAPLRAKDTVVIKKQPPSADEFSPQTTKKRQRDRDAAHTMSSLFASAAESATASMPVVIPFADPTSQIETVATLALPVAEVTSKLVSDSAYASFAQSESAYILSIDSEIDPIELDAALRLTWQEMSQHERTAYEYADLRASSASIPSAGKSMADAAVAAPSISQWSSTDIANYVSIQLGLPQYRAAFLHSGLTGAVLAEVTTAQLKKILKIDNLRDRKSIKAAFDQLVN